MNGEFLLFPTTIIPSEFTILDQKNLIEDSISLRTKNQRQKGLLAMTATAVAVSVEYVSSPPRQGFAAPVLAMLSSLRSIARGSARPLTRTSEVRRPL